MSNIYRRVEFRREAEGLHFVARNAYFHRGGKVELQTGHPYKGAECIWCSQMELVRSGCTPKPLQPSLKRNSGEAGLRSAWQPTATGLHFLGLMSRCMVRRRDGGRSTELWQPWQLTADTLRAVGGCGGLEPVRYLI